ncbi:DinB family protein [Niabella beijingensis]|uniref:DinB family protein n=1 Tax=Niabella beijingensis TaxID=2872700 RepID=UPI001CBB6014|nr:DinB family protein [Niabella beijingensis]MBZ4187755.1 DinB family protein [Niabella beijingensis]
MTLQSQSLLDSLAQLTKKHIRFAETLLPLPETALAQRPAAGGWNALECLEHLNRYSSYYLDALQSCISKAASLPAATYRPGRLGNYFAKIIHPDTSRKKMKTPQPMNALHASLNRSVVTTFIDNQRQLLQLLEQARKVDLGKEKTGTSLSKLIRLKLGDTLRFVIYHNERHIRQAENVTGGTKV